MLDKAIFKKMTNKLWDANRDIHNLLLKSASAEVAREKLYNYLWENEKQLFEAKFTIHPLEKVNIQACIRDTPLV